MTESPGGLKNLVLLFLPITLITFSNTLFLFVEKILLARLSTESMEVAVSAAYFCQIFQAPCIALAMMAQVFVGRWKGSRDLKLIGPGIWQFIWFSLSSTLVTFPVGFLFGNYFFNNTEINHIVYPYYYALLAINFIFPLSTALSCFYLGLGKTKLVLISSVAVQILKLLLAYLLIFGYPLLGIPSVGLLGGILSTAISQALFCLLLFVCFTNPKNSALYDTREWKLDLKRFWEYIQPGLLRAFNRILNFTSWAAITYMMTRKGGEHLLLFSVGGAIFVFLPFLGEAICQAQTTVVSQLIGARDLQGLKKAFFSGSILSVATSLLLIVPFIAFPSLIFHSIFPEISLSNENIRFLFLGIWVMFFFFTWGSVPISYILAFKDMKFSLFMGILSWINGFLFMYWVVNIIDTPANLFWLALSAMHLINFLIYYCRMRILQSRLKHPQAIIST